MYNLDQLRMFVTTADTGSFSACARRLGKVQSAISQGIANLEIDLGVELFDRSSRKAVITPAGKHLLAYARVMLQQSEELGGAARAIAQQQETAIRLAIDHALLLPALSALLKRFQQHFPATEVELLSVASPEVITHISSGRVDIGLMFSDMSYRREVDLRFIGNLSLVAVCSQQHPLAGMESLEMFQLAPHTQLVVRGESGKGLDHDVPVASAIWSASSMPAIVELVRQGIGWAYLPPHLITPHLNDGTMHRLPLRLDDKPWRPPVDLVTAKHAVMGPALRWLTSALKQLLPD